MFLALIFHTLDNSDIVFSDFYAVQR